MEFLKFSCEAELLKFFDSIDATVGPRKGPNKRTNTQKEIFNLRQYLTTLAENKLLLFPLSVEKSESPDFILCDSYSGCWGLEITQATTKAYQRNLTQTEGDGGDVELFARDGWVGNEPEREACAAIIQALRRKAKKIRRGKYRTATRYDVLIYVDVEAFFYEPNRAMELLLPRLEKWDSQWVGVGKASIIAKRFLYYDILNNVTRMNLVGP